LDSLSCEQMAKDAWMLAEALLADETDEERPQLKAHGELKHALQKSKTEEPGIIEIPLQPQALKASPLGM
jgi:hypothetical protein